MQMKVMKIIFNDIDLNMRDTPKIRGAVASKFPGYTLLHHHINKKRLLYKYPKIQYKTINRRPMIIGVDEGINVLREIYSDLGKLKIGVTPKPETQSEIKIMISEEFFGITDDLVEYRFETSWMPLSQKNFHRYNSGDFKRNDNLLKSIFIGNILSLSKSLGYTVGKQLLTLLKLSESRVNFKNKKMISFNGGFVVNFNIPDYLGLGKAVARGFGTVKRIKD